MAASLVSQAMAIFAKTENALPCSRLALTAHDFSDLVSGRGSIASFLCANLKPRATAAPSGSGGGEGGGASSPAGVELVGGVGDEKGVLSRRGRTEAMADPQDVRSPKSEPRSSTSSGGSSGMKGSNNPTPMAGDGAGSPREGVCPKCGEAVGAGEDLREHLDFHYAEGLQERYSREGDVAGEMAARMSDPAGLSKRRREGNKGKGGKKGKMEGRDGHKIDSFFKPA